jgi:hypothetical protein
MNETLRSLPFVSRRSRIVARFREDDTRAGPIRHPNERECRSTLTPLSSFESIADAQRYLAVFEKVYRCTPFS